MIRNGQNLTSYLETLRYQRLDEINVSRQLLVQIKDLILEDSTITDKKTALLDLYADEWLPSDVYFKLALHTSDNDFATAEYLIDQWPNNYNASSEEVEAMHNWLWMSYNATALTDSEISLTALQVQDLMDATHSELSTTAYMARAILELHGELEPEELLDIPVDNSLRSKGYYNTQQNYFKYQLYPNPTTNYTLLSASEVSLQDRQVTIYDIAGRQVYNQVWKSGNLQLIVPTDMLESGVYLVRIEDGTSTELTMIKQ